MPKLTYTHDGEEHTVEVTDSCSIGRAEGNTVALPKEIGASRRHAQIMKLSKSFEITDLGSTNGTKVNGKTVKRHRLEHGDRIGIGETSLVWETEDGGGPDIEEEISLEGDPAPKKGGGKTGADCYLVFAGGDRDGDRVPLDKPRITFGRKSSNTMVFESASVSGYHCEIAREGGAYVLRDLGSTNGTLLDGEPITEVALQHGGRVRIGDRRLVFVDPSVSDFENAMAAVDDLGSEWGMLRAEMDMSRVQKARRSQILAIFAVFAVLAAVAWVLFTKPEIFSTPDVALENTEGNVVQDFSFESLASGWTTLPGTPARGAFESGGSKQGESHYSVSRTGTGAPLAVVEFSERDFSARPGQPYRFGAAVTAAGGARAAVRVRWLGAGEGAAARHSSTPLSESSNWTTIEAVAVAPPNTTGARLQLVNAGDGKASFDDLFLVAGGSGGASAADGALQAEAGPDGKIAIRRGSDVLLEDLAVVGGLFGSAAETGERAERGGGTAAATSVVSEGGAVRVSGKTLDAATGEGGDYSLTVSFEGGRYVIISAELPGGAGVEGVVPQAFMETGLGFYTSTGSGRELSSRRVTGVQRATLGELNLFEISSEQPFKLALTTDGGSAVAFAAGEGEALALRIDTSSRDIIIARNRRYEEARTADQQGRYGQAIELYRAFAATLPEGDPKRVEAENRAAQLSAEGLKVLEYLRREAGAAKKFSEIAGLKAAVKNAERLRDSYGFEDAAAEIIAEATTALEALREQDAAQRAAPLLATAADYAKVGMKTLARLAYEDVAQRPEFQGTQAAHEAMKRLNELGRKD